jgi:hypothetical protein
MSDIQCPFGSICYQDAGSGVSTCTSPFSLPNGVMISGDSASLDQFPCSSGNQAYINNNFYCMGRAKQITPSNIPFPLGQQCSVEIFNDPLRPGVPEVGTVPSMCGYNKNSSSYCPSQLGDQLASEFISKVSATFKTGV